MTRRKVHPISKKLLDLLGVSMRSNAARRRTAGALLCFLFFFGLAAGPAAAEKPMRIELNDGSVIHGEIVSASDGVYTVKTADLGTLTLKESSIRDLRTDGAQSSASHGPVPGKQPGQAPGPLSIGDQVNALRDLMTSDESFAGIVTSLNGDPDFQAVLQDPDLMQAVASGDVSTLLSSSKFMKLLDNQSVQEIEKKLGKP